jgi:hypothetical protein
MATNDGTDEQCCPAVERPPHRRRDRQAQQLGMGQQSHDAADARRDDRRSLAVLQATNSLRRARERRHADVLLLEVEELPGEEAQKHPAEAARCHCCRDDRGRDDERSRCEQVAPPMAARVGAHLRHREEPSGRRQVH